MSKDKNITDTLDGFLESYLKPSFGNLSKTEIEIHVLKLLEENGKITELEKSSQYKLATELKVSPTKAKNLWYHWSLRKYKDEQFKEMLEEILLDPKYNSYKDEGGWFFLQIENPLLLEYVKNRIQELGHIQDGSFSSKIIKLQTKAFVSIIDDCIIEEKKSKILRELGIPENKFKALLIGAIKEFAEQHITKSGVDLATEVFTFLKTKIQTKDKK